MPQTRTESDSIGSIEVPAERLWGAQTERSLKNFSIGGERVPTEIIKAIVLIKKAVAETNAELGELSQKKATAIVAAADEVLAGLHDAEFPLLVFQNGSGTQTNMNVNEVLANRASEIQGGGRGDARIIHPNDDVNKGQSTNDVIPSAMCIAAAQAIRDRLLPVLRQLQQALADKGREFDGIVKVGRTHLQDAVPMTLGQEFSGYAEQLSQGIADIETAASRLNELALGGTAVGTGILAHPDLAKRSIAVLAEWTGLPLVLAKNPTKAIASHDGFVFVHGAIKTLATSLIKIANDIRLLASGPRAGLHELVLPANEPGSSIMPGKVNPTQCEALIQVCFQVLGNDVAINLAAMSGNLELNVYKMLIGHDVMQSLALLSDACGCFRDNCVEGIEADEKTIASHLDSSFVMATALCPAIGYDKVAELVKRVLADGKTLREVVIESGYLTGEQYDALVR